MKIAALPLLFLLAPLAGACATSSHPTEPSTLGAARRSSEMLAAIDVPGPITAETINSADWVVGLGGLLNLDHERAVAAGLEDREEPIQIYFHVLRHPEHGTFIIDTGVERALRDDPENSAIDGMVASFMETERMQIHLPLGDWLAKQAGPLAGVLLTHLHVDHLIGMPDVPKGTPIYAGPGETGERSFQNLFVQGVTDRLFEGHSPIRAWRFERDADGRFEGVIDVFGDGSLFALWVPGHTPGSTAYLARTTEGPVLYTGDACHTRWGWDHGVEPGTFSSDVERSAESLARLAKLAAEHPSLRVHLGHQR